MRRTNELGDRESLFEPISPVFCGDERWFCARCTTRLSSRIDTNGVQRSARCERFSQTLNGRFQPFASNSHPSVQKPSAIQLNYHMGLHSRCSLCSTPPSLGYLPDAGQPLVLRSDVHSRSISTAHSLLLWLQEGIRLCNSPVKPCLSLNMIRTLSAPP